MDIISYLVVLLESEKAIGITGLGTLYKKKKPGRYDVETHSFLPPSYELAFTTAIQEEEVLANHICKQRNITLDSANYYIQQFADQVNVQLADHQVADLSPLGRLKIHGEEITFEIIDPLKLGFDFYGLPPVVVQPIKKQVEATIQKQENEPEQPTELPTVEPIVESIKPKEEAALVPEWISNTDDDEDDDDEERPGRALRVFLKTLLILVVLAIIGAGVYFLFPDFFEKLNPNFSKQHIENLHPEGADTLSTLDTGANIAIDSIAEATSPITIPLDSPAHQTVVVYDVIESAMKSQKKVDEIIQNMAKRGIKAKQINPISGRLIKISIGTFTDFDQAKKYQDSLRIKLKNPDIYIQKSNTQN